MEKRKILMSILRGDFMTILPVSKFFIHIIWTFVLAFLVIFISLRIETTLAKEEDGKKRLQDMEIYHAQKTVELVSLGRMTTVERMLEEKGSKVSVPEKPAIKVK
ncbi:MAG: hypothetical protein K5984_01025 [Bacteroidales bacterium]|jgi:hypothetical protein|nr:hypothetical protein [Bacteroidales bacterium]